MRSLSHSLFLLALACGTPSEEVPDDATADDAAIPLRPRANPTEYTGLTVRQPVAEADAHALVAPFFGIGGLHDGLQLQPGLEVRSTDDARTPDQVAIEVALTVTGDTTPARRTVALVPASRAYGELFLDLIDAAVARTLEVNGARPGDMSPWRLEYRTRSANGGRLTLALDHSGFDLHLVVDVEGPRTSLLETTQNEPAYGGDPYETLYGLVNFSLSQDEFDFFATRAYGITNGAGQNFADFRLLPHSWLRLTVTPRLDDERVDVGFELVTTDGRRVPVAKAPASLKAGEQFMQNVFRLVTNMTAAEEAEPGSSLSWRAPFYYDDPASGGVVEVIAQGSDGRFGIAYAVETPAHPLRDVDFVRYQGDVSVPADWDKVDPTCAELGSTESAQGTFEMRFDASPTVRKSTKLKAPLRGNVYGSVYRAEDVTISGPNEGTEAVASFRFDGVDVVDGPSAAYTLDTPLNAGAYQILGFLDIDANADTDNPDPDPGDPVMIPIGGFDLQCLRQPVTVEYAILLPAGF